MTLTEFKQTISHNTPQADLSVYLLAMWFDARGDWNEAHKIIQDVPGKSAAWIHAYLHRKEGDVWNADYWYAKAGQERPDCSLEEEWDRIVSQLLQNFKAAG